MVTYFVSCLTNFIAYMYMYENLSMLMHTHARYVTVILKNLPPFMKVFSLSYGKMELYCILKYECLYVALLF